MEGTCNYGYDNDRVVVDDDDDDADIDSFATSFIENVLLEYQPFLSINGDVIIWGKQAE